MRLGILVVAATLAFTGCARTQVSRKAGESGYSNIVGTNAPILRPSSIVAGRVDWVNPKARYVVISFPIGWVPPVDSRLNVYRTGLKVAEVKVSLPQQNNLTAADITAGECQVGDEVRAN